MSYTFHLRPGVKFHNGKDFTADDVKFTFDRVLNKDFGSPHANFSAVSQVNVIDDLTVQFVLAHPYAPFVIQLDGVYIEPNLPDNDFSKTPIGTGPFSFVEWISGDHIQVAKNPNYWMSGQPYIDGVTFRPIVEPSTRVVDLESGNVAAIIQGQSKPAPRGRLGG